MTDEEIQLALRLQEIFMPYSMGQRREASERQGTKFMGPEGLRFAHYTSAEAALKILQTKRIWMRNTTCMSDYREVQHGFEMLQRFFSVQANTEAFVKALDVCAPGAAMEAIKFFDDWWKNHLPLNIYVTSLSEHSPGEEDLHGRLSMWRAFGSNSSTRVAIVIRVPSHSGGAQALSIAFSPVAYLKESEVHQQIHSVAANVANESVFLKTLDRKIIVNMLFMMLYAGVTCLKHEGFREEQEWRAVYNNNVFPSTLMDRAVEVIGGVPQHVYKLPLDQTVSSQLGDLDISKIVDRVIIGPSPFPWVLYQAFVEALQNAGVSDAENRVHISGIPIRN